jgi:16S rRNA (cytidine1402-2'-O)-methyltransferase
VAGTLWLVGTPIGNLEDITERARRVLASADLIAAEDTRRTGRLLHHLSIEGKRLVSFFEGNEARRTEELLEELRHGADVAVVTDAGMPGVSDPGYRLVAACAEAGIPVDVAPGPSAALAALVISGLPTDRFVFEGFLPRSGRARSERLEALAAEPRTAVVFESPRRMGRTLGDLLASGGDRRVVIARELTKLHQEVIRGTLSQLVGRFGEEVPRGEVVLVIEGVEPHSDPGEALGMARELVAEGHPKRAAARSAARRTGIPASAIYSALVGETKPPLNAAGPAPRPLRRPGRTPG